MSLRDVILKKMKHDSEFQKEVKVVRCVTVGVDYSESSAVYGREGFVWVREWGASGSTFQVFAPSVPHIVDLPVWVGRIRPDQNREILGVDWSIFPFLEDYDGELYSEQHHNSHEWADGLPGNDVVSIYPRAFVPGRLMYDHDTDFTVVINSMKYRHAGGIGTSNGEYLELDSYVPDAGKAVRLLVCINPKTSLISIFESAEVDNTDTPDYLDVPVGYIPIAYVLLDGDASELEEEDIVDARTFTTSGTTTMEQFLKVMHQLDIENTCHIVNGGVIP